jgi:peptidyl-prolyl cis-trans isomerase C
MYRSLTALSFSFALLMAGSAFAQSDSSTTEPVAPALEQAVEPATSQIVARVNGIDISYAEVLISYQNLPKQYRSLPVTAIQEQLVGRLIEQKLLVGLAKSKGVEKDAEFIAQKEYLVSSLLEQSLIADLYESSITDEDLQEAYKALVAKSGENEEIRARHILLKEKVEAEAVIASLEAGGDFVELAKEKSTGPTGPRGGDLGYFQSGQMVKPFADAAFALEIGGFTKEPVQTQFGWHVILTEDRRAVAPPAFEESKETLLQELQEGILSSVLAAETKKATIEKFPFSQK